VVRDLILKEENFDIDLVVEGNGIGYSEKLAKLFKGKVKSHKKFQTAVVSLPGNLKIDIASSRMEYYDRPAALPTVERGMLRQDLYRRDFTINTLAVKINTNEYGTLFDYFGGRKDLRESKMRVIHGLSFIEDPTRAYRAVRFANRLGFDIAKETKNLIRAAVKKGIFERLTGRRILKELTLIFEDEHPVKTVKMLESFGLLEYIHPQIKLTKAKLTLLYRVEEVLSWYRLLYRSDNPDNHLVYFMGLIDSLEEKSRLEIGQRLRLRNRDRELLRDYPGKIHRVVSSIQKKGKVLDSHIYFQLIDLTLETVLFLIAKIKNVELKKAMTSYLLHFRSIKLEIKGADLKSLGLEPGPEYSRIFQMILSAKIDGKVKNKRGEIAMAKKLIKRKHKNKKS
jgi:tRNA nucleotidyltransferase (CCA-adding enzyme)